MNNFLASQTLKYIWSHPNSKGQQIQAILKFIGWQLYKRITKRTVILNLLPEIKLYCQPDSLSASTVLYCALYDYEEMNFLLRYLRPEDSFLDVGANVGVYSLLAASKIKTGWIYAFEALPKNYQRLQDNIKLNEIKNIKTYQVAVSDRVGTIHLNLPESDSMAYISLENSVNSIEVATDTIENLLRQESIENLTLAKMDIEGAELLAFQGANSLLTHHRPYVWILEINDCVNNFGYQKEDLVNLKKNYEYSIYQYSRNSNSLNPLSLDNKKGNNILAIYDQALDFVKERLNC
ncbi:MAG: FkbM family methyltransferase [Gomphosphaeria aponina SAG 52.96 = DSM 107014]|uniref:FkbM family methyltransferase n=1 Tax=Gomphosphaeria aponina SAG 52.96 = DSM 107014 TaxID=1521640 RepID=A0A941JQP1_9CHRO|nr:FkbM family methyltransferase [Gomphosphaeria aponina SAG 52.96 = DSM 107014]